jgi:uncharacterized Zn finger protein
MTRNQSASSAHPPQQPADAGAPSSPPSTPPIAPPPAHAPGPRPGTSYQHKPVKPRKVRGGIRLARDDASFSESWAAQRWMRLIEERSPAASLPAGLEYARLGQTRRMAIDPGKVKCAVQGTIISSYECSISLPVLSHEQSERIISAMVDQAVYAAKLLAGELPPNIEDVFASQHLRLFPEAAELAAHCNCREQTKPWCKHTACIAWLIAERFTQDPFLIFTLRGLPREELLERLRQRRQVAGSGGGTAIVYSPVVPGVSDQPIRPLEEMADRFWDPPASSLETLDLPIQPPEVSHPLLRRLGPSPFAGGRFPLVGLLATSYGMISEAALKRAESEGGEESTTEHAPDAELEGDDET